ncbi:MAG TPA: protein kinase [Gemmatimonadaceae bacterium]
MTATLTRLLTALAGRYAIEREIGAGGMAIVYLAEDLKHRRRVAIKVLKPELAASLGSDRFLREIEIAARLSHPHILPLFDSGAANDLLYYVMPFVPGESLRSKLAREGRLPVDEALKLTREIAAALGSAHHQGIVHRDIKPENILLAEGIALVADFGIARALRSSRASGETASALTMAGLAIGTPAYMSPEQFTADDVDGRSDLYALGCVLFEMLAGQPPFTGQTVEALLRQHLTAEPRPVSDLRPTVPTGIVAIVAKALAKDPANRFPSAASFAEAIATVVSGGVTPIRQETGTGTPNNLPRQRTRFIGRERELAECARLLGETRLLTLTGIGGSGKTRVALRLAESMLPSFPDGVWFVDLAPLVDAGRLPGTVAAAVGVTETPDRPLLDAVIEKFRGTRTLIVFDNCEHLLGAAAELVDVLLSADEGVRIVATSREGLGVEGERQVAIRSMRVPPETQADLRAVQESDAVRFFVDRAVAARRDFALGPENAGSIAEICRRLDGIPLAIELAAARVKVLSVEQIRSRLDDRFRLLTGGRSAVPRQQTLLATIQWSYEQLLETEQQLLRRLSVFAGGWTLESATAVAGGGADEFDVLDLLTRLIDKSLVLVEQGGTSEARYSMLETVRQYGLERLVERGESESIRDRHLTYFMSLGEQCYAEMFTREEYWGTRLTSEIDNVRAAASFAREHDPERYVLLVGAMAYVLAGRSRIREASELLNDALSRVSPEPVRRSYARALRGQAMFSALMGDTVRARELNERGLAMWRKLDDAVEIGHSLATLGWSHFFGNEEAKALETFEELLRVAGTLGDPVYINQARVALGQVLVALSRLDEARAMARAVLEFSRKAGDKRAEHSGYHYLADCALLEGDCRTSVGLYRQSLALAEAIGDRVETSFEVEGMAMSMACLGHHEAAVRLVAAMRAEWTRQGVDFHLRFWDALHERYMLPARQALGAERADAVERAGRELGFEEAIREAYAAAESY